MTARPRLHRLALRELRAAVSRYEEKQEGLGRRFFETVDATIEHVGRGELPGLMVLVHGRPLLRRVRVRRFPYWLYFEFTTTECVILAVAHSSRRPGYWTRRSVADAE